MIGGAGDDEYSIWDFKSTIVEAPNGGIDTLYSWAYGPLTMPDNVENLFLEGDGSTYAYGNSLNNIMVAGSTGAFLDGGAGDDVLVGGAGADTFNIKAGNGSDAIYQFTPGTDKIDLVGYGISSFAQLTGLATQVGADVRFQLSSTESLVLRNTQLSSLSASDFNLSVDMSKMTMSFDDEFNNLSLQSSGGIWMTNYGTGYANVDHGYGGESQVYVDPSYTGSGKTALGINPFSISSDGVLTITAAPVTASAKSALGSALYTSGVLSSHHAFSQEYGYFEVRAALPSGQGFWPAFWLLPASGAWPPELDIMESLGKDPGQIYMTSHDLVNGADQQNQSTFRINDPTAMHTYGINWTKSTITWYIDGTAVFSEATPDSMKTGEFYMNLNLAVGSNANWAGAPTSSTGTGQFKIDYVHVYANSDTVSRTVNGTQSFYNSATGTWSNGSGTVVNGAPQVDTLLLAASNVDLAVSYGTDANLLQQAYAASNYTLSTTSFDATAFAAAHPDIVAKVGSTTDALATAYVNLLKGFDASSFDALGFAATNIDIAQQFGTDTAAITNWYLHNGILQGRTIGTFNAKQFADTHPDIVAKVGNTTAALEQAYIGLVQAYNASTFDALGFAASHPEVAAKFGTDATKIAKWYLNYGIIGGYNATVTFDAASFAKARPDLVPAGSSTAAIETIYINLIKNFDPLQFAASNIDVAQQFGTDTAAITAWYQSTGINQVRSSTTFYAPKFAASHPDLVAQYGNSNSAMATAYINLVKNFDPTKFDALEFAASNPDVALKFGADTGAIARWYLNYGIADGRKLNGFDARAYAAANPDLAAKYGSDTNGLLVQYLTQGIIQGRPTGGAGDQTITASTLNATLTGTAAADRFVIGLGKVHDVITDFGNGRDTLDLSAFTKAGYSPVISAQGSNTLISFGNGASVTLTGVTASHLAQNSGIFATA